MDFDVGVILDVNDSTTWCRYVAVVAVVTATYYSAIDCDSYAACGYSVAKNVRNRGGIYCDFHFAGFYLTSGFFVSRNFFFFWFERKKGKSCPYFLATSLKKA